MVRRRKWIVRHTGLATLLALASATVAGSADQPVRWELKGACYCRASGDLMCTADMTENECGRRCREELCDEWFWLERRPCWNWGYGG